jgi:hypothetical protein
VIEHCAQFFIQKHKAVRQWQFGVGYNLAIVDMGKTIAFLTDNAPAGGSQAGVKPKDDHDDIIIPISP